LFAIQNNAGTSKYLDVTAAGVSVDGNLTVSGTYNTNTFNSNTLTFGNTGTAASIDAATGQDLNLGTGASNHTTVLGSTNGTSTTTVQSGSCGIGLNGNTTLGAGNNFTFASGAGNFDQSASTGTLATGTGSVSLNGDTTVAAGKS